MSDHTGELMREELRVSSCISVRGLFSTEMGTRGQVTLLLVTIIRIMVYAMMMEMMVGMYRRAMRWG